MAAPGAAPPLLALDATTYWTCLGKKPVTAAPSVNQIIGSAVEDGIRPTAQAAQGPAC